jgi:hypothetical protein
VPVLVLVLGLGFVRAVRAAGRGPGVHAQQDVQERAGAQRVQAAVQARAGVLYVS